MLYHLRDFKAGKQQNVAVEGFENLIKAFDPEKHMEEIMPYLKDNLKVSEVVEAQLRAEREPTPGVKAYATRILRDYVEQREFPRIPSRTGRGGHQGPCDRPQAEEGCEKEEVRRVISSQCPRLVLYKGTSRGYNVYMELLYRQYRRPAGCLCWVMDVCSNINQPTAHISLSLEHWQTKSMPTGHANSSVSFQFQNRDGI